MRLFGKVNTQIDRFDRAVWQTSPFDLALVALAAGGVAAWPAATLARAARTTAGHASASPVRAWARHRVTTGVTPPIDPGNGTGSGGNGGSGGIEEELMASLIDPTQAPYHCVPGQDCTAGLQQALDAAGQGSDGGKRGVALSAPGDWTLSRPLLMDQRNVAFYGTRGARLVVSPYNPNDALVLGLARTNVAGRTITADNFMTSGGLTGLRLYNPVTGGYSWIQVQNHPFMLGAPSAICWPSYDNWDETQQLTIEVQFDRDPTGDWTLNQMLCGMGDSTDNGSNSYPFTLWAQDTATTLKFALRTADIPWGVLNPDHHWTFSIAGMARPYKLRITIDLVAGLVKFYDCSPTTPVLLAATFTASFAATMPFAGGGLHFATNLNYPFLVGSRGLRGLLGQPNTKLVLYGLQLATGIASGAFAPRTSASNSIAFVPASSFTPGAVYHGRFLPVQSGDAAGSFTTHAAWINAEDAGAVPDDILLSGLEIAGATGRGAGVLIGSTFGTRVEACKINGAAVAVANLNIGGNWPVHVNNCRLGGYDTAYSGFYQMGAISNIRIDSCGYDVFRFTGGNMDLTGIFAPANARARQFYSLLSGGEGGGGHSLRGVIYNNEGFALKCGIYVEQQGYGFGSMVIENSSLGNAAYTGPAILCQRMSNTYNNVYKLSQLDITTLAFGASYTPAVVIQAPGLADVVHDCSTDDFRGPYNAFIEF